MFFHAPDEPVRCFQLFLAVSFVIGSCSIRRQSIVKAPAMARCHRVQWRGMAWRSRGTRTSSSFYGNIVRTECAGRVSMCTSLNTYLGKSASEDLGALRENVYVTMSRGDSVGLKAQTPSCAPFPDEKRGQPKLRDEIRDYISPEEESLRTYNFSWIYCVFLRLEAVPLSRACRCFSDEAALSTCRPHPPVAAAVVARSLHASDHPSWWSGRGHIFGVLLCPDDFRFRRACRRCHLGCSPGNSCPPPTCGDWCQWFFPEAVAIPVR